MIAVGINLSHDASICVVEDGEIIHYQESERLIKEKHSVDFFFIMREVFEKYNDCVDEVVVAHLNDKKSIVGDLAKYYLGSIISRYCGNDVTYRSISLHHYLHASNAFYGSNFDHSAILVIDGRGEYVVDGFDWGHETESIFYMDMNSPSKAERLVLNLDSNMSDAWSSTCLHYGLEEYDAGKLMGASAYGNHDENYPCAYVNGRLNPHFSETLNLGKISLFDASYRLQHDSFDVVCDWVETTIKLTGENNICCSGGYFMNVVNNYKLVEKYPHINFYFDPICTDNGNAIGLAKSIYYNATGDTKKYPLKSLYLGSHANYYDVEGQRPTTPREVAELLADKNIVAIYQGQSEAGPRALGNRSFLYDPRDLDGRDRVNTIKKREYYRPFAGSVLEEHAHDWFEMMHLKSSPFMSYAIPCKESKRELVPALQHEDGTSRIQTVNREQNEHYYDLIQEFYELTGVPMVLNTSFNLAGDTMVDNFDDAVYTCKKGNIRYLYLPEKQMLVDFGE